MIILTAKLPRHRKLTIGVAVAALACCAALVLTLGGGPAREASASAVPSPKGVKSNEDRVAYLEGYGWQVLEEPLAKYAGKRVKRYTYEITNYPTGETGILANLLIYKNTVIGGEVLSPQLDGFLHGLAMP